MSEFHYHFRSSYVTNMRRTSGLSTLSVLKAAGSGSVATSTISVADLPEDILYAVFFHHLMTRSLATHSDFNNTIFMGMPPHCNTFDEDRTILQKRRKILSRVCRSWRRLVQCSPSLWSAIFNDRLKVVTKHLLRSQQSPLVVQWEDMAEVSASSSVPALRAILDHLPRIQRLDVISHQDVLQQATSGVSGSAPQLTSLSLVRLERVESYDPTSIPEPLEVMNVCNMPNLKEVRLFGYHFLDWSLFPSQLTHLHIQMYSGRRHRMTSLPFVVALDAIRRMQGLQRLLLVDCLQANHDVSNPRPVPNEAKAYLVHLKYLCISAPGLSCAHICEHLVIPSTCGVHLSFTDPDHHGGEIDSSLITRAVLGKYSGPDVLGPPRAVPRSASMLAPTVDDTEVHFWPDVCNTSDRKRRVQRTDGDIMEHEGHFSVKLALSPWASDYHIELLDVILPALFAEIPLGDIQVLFLSPDLALKSVKSFKSLMRRTPKLPELVLEGISDSAKLLLFNTKKSSKATNQTSFPFRNVRILRIWDSHFDLTDGNTPTMWRDLWLLIMTAIRERDDAGCRFEYLEVDRMHAALRSASKPTPAHIEALRRTMWKWKAHEKHFGKRRKDPHITPYSWYEPGSGFPFVWSKEELASPSGRAGLKRHV